MAARSKCFYTSFAELEHNTEFERMYCKQKCLYEIIRHRTPQNVSYAAGRVTVFRVCWQLVRSFSFIRFSAAPAKDYDIIYESSNNYNLAPNYKDKVYYLHSLNGTSVTDLSKSLRFNQFPVLTSSQSLISLPDNNFDLLFFLMILARELLHPFIVSIPLFSPPLHLLGTDLLHLSFFDDFSYNFKEFH
ncbi:unnamed protein product [Gongylonema pulchrum]|uniref:LysM domain-containing protein n=1 Tax=Gongylonema pulchrum TaxID=637853 RepID=A0A183DPZ7_9BILA|nr:unnamed protein product [Gongylonema pulchrum]